jgi:hypothetical protein
MNRLKFVASAALAFALAACSGQYDAAQYGPGGAVKPAQPTAQAGPNVAAQPAQQPTAALNAATPTPQPQNVTQAPQNAILSDSTAELIDAMALSGDELAIAIALVVVTLFLLFVWFMAFVVLAHAERRGL